MMLELMHFPSELRDLADFRQPSEAKVGKKELDMARNLIASMTDEWDPQAYKDDYRDAVQEMIDEKIARGDKAAPKTPSRKRATNVIDLVAVLQQSLAAGKKKPAPSAAKPRKKAVPSKKRA